MISPYRWARIRDFLLAAAGGGALLLAFLLLLLRIKFPGQVEAQFGVAFWKYLGGTVGAAALCAAIYAAVPPPR